MTSLTLDHLVIAVRDLDAAAASYQRLLGRKPSWRGRHPTYGTANVLFRLDNTYLELLAPGDRSESSWPRALRNHLDTRGEGLYAIALGTDGVDAAVDAARRRGLEVQDPADGDGIDFTTGARREWRNARIDPASTRGVRAFFIEHRSASDALPVAEPVDGDGSFVSAVDHTVIAASDLAACLRVWHEALGLDLRLTLDGPIGRRLHFLRLGDSVLELAGAAEATPRGRDALALDPGPLALAGRGSGDALWGVAYRVANVGRAVERLRAEGVDVSDARAGNAPGTLVADLKPGFSHDVRTLLIEKTVARREVAV